MLKIKSSSTKLYLFVTFFITFLFWGIDGILSANGLYTHPSYHIGIVFYIIGVNAPVIATYITLHHSEETKGRKQLLRFTFSSSKIGVGITLVAIFLLVRFLPLVIIGSITTTGQWYIVLAYTPLMLIFGGFEEIGWRGFLQPRLENRFGFFLATCINAGIWIVWHIPLCFIQGTYQYSNNYIWFAISLIGSTFSLCALRKISNSICLCMLFHIFGNAIVSYGFNIQNDSTTIVATIVATLLQITLSLLSVEVNKKNQYKKMHRMSII